MDIFENHWLSLHSDWLLAVRIMLKGYQQRPTFYLLFNSELIGKTNQLEEPHGKDFVTHAYYM